MSDFNENDYTVVDDTTAAKSDYPEFNEVEGSTVTFSENAEGYEDAPINVKPETNGLTSLLIGLIFTVINCVMTGLLLSGSTFVFGGIFIIFPIWGLVSGIKAFKAEGAQKIMGIIGFILNIFTTIGAAIFFVLGIISKFI